MPTRTAAKVHEATSRKGHFELTRTGSECGSLQEIRNASGEVLTYFKPPPGSESALQHFWETAVVLWSVYDCLVLALAVISAFFFRKLRVIATVYIIYVRFFANTHKIGAPTFRSKWLRSLNLWRYLASYYPLTLYRSAPLSPKRKYVFGYHPHGILLRGAMATFATNAAGFAELFPGIDSSLLVKDETFVSPGYREYAMALGMNGVSKQSCLNLLSTGGHDGAGQGNSIAIMLGGRREYDTARPGAMDVVINIRKGFIKVAIETGADIVPVIGFGENELYREFAPEGSWSTWFWNACERRFGVKPRYIGRFYDLTPHRRRLDVVIGKPIQVKKQHGELDLNYVEALHSQYVHELKKIWSDWRDIFEVDPSVTFRIIE